MLCLSRGGSGGHTAQVRRAAKTTRPGGQQPPWLSPGTPTWLRPPCWMWPSTLLTTPSRVVWCHSGRSVLQQPQLLCPWLSLLLWSGCFRYAAGGMHACMQNVYYASVDLHVHEVLTPTSGEQFCMHGMGTCCVHAHCTVYSSMQCKADRCSSWHPGYFHQLLACFFVLAAIVRLS